MNAPLITKLINGYDFFWAEEQVQIKVTRLDTHRDGRVTADILISTTKEEYQPVLMQPFQINFTALRTVEMTAKSLKASYPHWDWQSIMSVLAFKVQELARSGEPSEEFWISEDEEVPEIEYLVYPVVLKNQPIILYGLKEASKSTFAYYLYISLMLPWHDNPLCLTMGEKPIPTLYLDWETDAETFKWTMKRLRKGHGLPSFPVYYRHCEAPLAEDIEDIQKEVEQRKAKVIIIDSIGQAAGGEDLEKPKPALDLFKALRKLRGVTPIMIGQTSKKKSQKGENSSVFGTTFFQYYARSIWEIVKSAQEEDTDQIQVALFHRYSNYTAHHHPVGYRIFYTPTSIRLESCDVSIADFMEKVGVNSQIYETLKSKKRACTVEDLLDELGLKRNTIVQGLNRLKKKNKVVKLTEGKWGLVSEYTPTPEE